MSGLSTLAVRFGRIGDDSLHHKRRRFARIADSHRCTSRTGRFIAQLTFSTRSSNCPASSFRPVFSNSAPFTAKEKDLASRDRGHNLKKFALKFAVSGQVIVWQHAGVAHRAKLASCFGGGQNVTEFKNQPFGSEKKSSAERFPKRNAGARRAHQRIRKKSTGWFECWLLVPLCLSLALCVCRSVCRSVCRTARSCAPPAVPLRHTTAASLRHVRSLSLALTKDVR